MSINDSFNESGLRRGGAEAPAQIVPHPSLPQKATLLKNEVQQPPAECRALRLHARAERRSRLIRLLVFQFREPNTTAVYLARAKGKQRTCKAPKV